MIASARAARLGFGRIDERWFGTRWAFARKAPNGHAATGKAGRPGRRGSGLPEGRRRMSEIDGLCVGDRRVAWG
jgi:hypothetical protein